MQNSAFHYRSWAVGTKLTSLTLGLVGLLFAAAILLTGYVTSSMLEKHAMTQIQGETHGVVNMVEMFDRSVNSQVERFSNMFGNSFPDKILDRHQPHRTDRRQGHARAAQRQHRPEPGFCDS